MSADNMASEVDGYYDTILELVKQCGQIINEKIYSTDKTVEEKSCDIDLVTETDRQVERLLIDSLSSKYPEHKFIGEETVSEGGRCVLTSAPTWIIDPIDGTLNFVHGFPHSCVSVGLLVNSIPEIGIIYNPMLNQLFTARRGKGAYLNGAQIHVSGQTDITKMLIMMENGTSRGEERTISLRESQAALIPVVHGIRCLGSAALNMAMVALGGADAYFEFGIHVWDIAAGELIVTEAGGVVLDPEGGALDRFSRRVLCASSPALAEQLSKKIVPCTMPRD